MPLSTLLYGILITSLGIIGYFATGQVSKTALIPCVFGLPVIALAIAAWLKPRASKQTAIAAIVIAVLAFGGTAKSFASLPMLLTGAEVERPAAVIVQIIMAIASLIYIAIAATGLRQSPTKN